MNEKEFAKVVTIIKASYPKEKLVFDDITKQVWYSQLKDLDYKLVATGLERWIATERFSPSIAEIRQMAAEIIAPKMLSDVEAWHLVHKAMGNCAYGLDEEWAALPEMVKKAVGSKHVIREFGLSEDYTSVSVFRSQFMRSYNMLVERQKIENQTSLETIQRMKQLRVDRELKELGEGINDLSSVASEHGYTLAQIVGADEAKRLGG